MEAADVGSVVVVVVGPLPGPIGLLFSTGAISLVAMSTIIHSYPCPGSQAEFRFFEVSSQKVVKQETSPADRQ